MHRVLGRLASVPVFFGFRVASALVLLKLSASFLPVAGFTVLSQLMLFAALLNVLALCGAQNGVVRQAAAAAGVEGLAQTQAAAFAIWGVAVPLALIPTLAGGALISRILVGSPAQAMVVPAITAVTLLGAPGQIWCALLTGRKRVARSLLAQAAGLLAGAGAAGWRIMAHDPAGAAVAFAGGSVITAAIALPFALQLKIPLIPAHFAWPSVKTLLRYSVAFAATTGFASIVLFGLRSVYRDHFGATQLGYWLAANRVSDMSTQLLGLFMIQVFVPHMAGTHDESRRRAILLRCWAVAVGVMSSFVVIFSLASGLLIHLFLSDAYLPAAPVIRTYMIGDVLRVWASLAMFTAFANGKPLRYAGIEVGALSVMAVVTAALIAAGDPAAPQQGYVIAYAVTAALVSGVFLLRPAPEPAVA
jgi:O-antigen/teichoic acid export membrane protein